VSGRFFSGGGANLGQQIGDVHASQLTALMEPTRESAHVVPTFVDDPHGDTRASCMIDTASRVLSPASLRSMFR